MKEKKYYTAGELARLFNIPKQTMLYYDKMGILKPEFVAENGYRYYSTPQYLTLEIILFLRKMDISVPDIRKFLENRSRDNILRILDRRKEECLQQIDQARRLIHSLDTYRNTLERSQSLPLNQVLLQNYHDCRMFLTPIPKDKGVDYQPFPSAPAMCGKPFPTVSARKNPQVGSSVRMTFSTTVSVIPRRWSQNQDRPALTSPVTMSAPAVCTFLCISKVPISTMARIRWNECRILWIKTVSSLTEMYSFSPSSAIGSPITPKSISTPSA